MNIAIKSYDLKLVLYNTFNMKESIERYVDTKTSHRQYDDIVSRLKEEFAISFTGISTDFNVIFDVLDQNVFTTSCSKHELAYRAIQQDEKVFLFKEKDTLLYNKVC